ncbi:Putative transcriptional regulator, TetR-family [Corynebacterium glyciniphilum AJ 3170]|uniref:Putative transcriptional regulator, TetR-family n=1 Tax=Corynebacterium glyciniphilum AJ 3170 TaxID=1404245 RepID=X5DQI2_9CORY|nr:TetR/AcrR family transcriptional regulator [Corynebacterium glyciniphilum]AHW63544.1 Putative transcriptional regulator, TetR-family [Corynebacterium glyciniphilum AJ 3170]
MSEQSQGQDRRAEIADAGIRIIASRGVRALTHRAIDTEVGLSAGSTSYYARTRRDLIVLIVGRLATRTTADMSAVQWPDFLTVSTAATLVARAIGATLQREEEHVARIALHIEYRHDDEIRALLAGDPPVQPHLVAAAERCLQLLGVDDAAEAAADFVGLVDGLLMRRIIRGGGVDVSDDAGAERIVRNYLAGLVAGER